MHRLFLPMSRFEMDKWRWNELDVILITGDAFIDHPYFSVAIMSRLLERQGLRVGIIAQPNPIRDMEFAHMGAPRLFFAVTAGYADSMEANRAANKKIRKFDNYTPGRIVGKRADRASIVYSKTLKRLFPDVPVVLFGMEASLRRLVHYDFWDNEIKMSILSESGADILIYGPGEKQMQEISTRLSGGESVNQMKNIRGTVYKLDLFKGSEIKRIVSDDYVHMPSFEQIYIEREAYIEAFRAHYFESDPYTGKNLVQEHPAHYIIQNPPAMPLTTKEMDDIFALDYIRTPHPRYKRAGAIPIFETIKFSLMTHRGCFSGCGHCSTPVYEGRYIQSRSAESILKEAEQVSAFHYFRGWISNIGGPIGNMWNFSCDRENQESVSRCERPTCTYPDICPHLKGDQGSYLELCEKVLNMENVEKAYIATGLRYDLLSNDPKGEELLKLYLSELIQINLKFAPEHLSDSVTKRIRKYDGEKTEAFVNEAKRIIKEKDLGDIVFSPYFISGHPGSDLRSAIEAAQFMKRNDISQCKIHDFLPMPMTPSTCMFYSGVDPFTMEKVYRPLAYKERKLQRALLHWYQPQNQRYVYEALVEAEREDLIGEEPDCLLAEKPKIYKF